MNQLWSQRHWRPVLGLAIVTALCGVLLIGVSAWFLASVALAGLGAAAFTYNYHVPAALIRLFALTRTAGKYGERLAGHAAALRDQASHRYDLFRRMAAASGVRAAGWQLSRDDQLGDFINDVETCEYRRLRVGLPGVAGGIVLVLTLAVTALTVPVALLPGGAVLIGVILLAHTAAAQAGVSAEVARRSQAEWSLALGRQLGALVAISGARMRGPVFNETFANVAEDAGHRRRQARATSLAEVIAALAGPAMLLATILIAHAGGQRGEAMLPAVFAGFVWLAAGEAMTGLVRQSLARRLADDAQRRLAAWQGDDTAPGALPTPLHLCVSPRDLYSPRGDRLPRRVSFTARRGAPVAILGPSGCGKTALLKEVAGWTPWRAAGPHPLGADPAAVRAQCHLCLHDATVFAGTARENFMQSAPDDVMWRAMEMVELDARIGEQGGLDAPLGGQAALSLGEVRRFALARAIVSPEPVLLLDEPGEHLDRAQSARILQRILRQSTDRLVVFVTHDPALAALAPVRLAPVRVTPVRLAPVP